MLVMLIIYHYFVITYEQLAINLSILEEKPEENVFYTHHMSFQMRTGSGICIHVEGL